MPLTQQVLPRALPCMYTTHIFILIHIHTHTHTHTHTRVYACASRSEQGGGGGKRREGGMKGESGKDMGKGGETEM
jgi:hypothetical protein